MRSKIKLQVLRALRSVDMNKGMALFQLRKSLGDEFNEESNGRKICDHLNGLQKAGIVYYDRNSMRWVLSETSRKGSVEEMLDDLHGNRGIPWHEHRADMLKMSQAITDEDMEWHNYWKERGKERARRVKRGF